MRNISAEIASASLNATGVHIVPGEIKFQPYSIGHYVVKLPIDQYVLGTLNDDHEPYNPEKPAYLGTPLVITCSAWDLEHFCEKVLHELRSRREEAHEVAAGAGAAIRKHGE